MTAILGYYESSAVWIAADTQSTGHDGRVTTFDSKIVQVGDWLFASAGWARLKYLVTAQAHKLCSVTSPWDFCQVAAEVARDDGWRLDTATGPADFNQSFLLASKTGLWLADSAFTPYLLPRARPYGLGSGGEVAMGAATAFLESGAAPAQALMRGIAIAIAHFANCGGTVEIRSIRLEPGAEDLSGLDGDHEGPAPAELVGLSGVHDLDALA